MRIPNILVIDDELSARESLRMILGKDYKLFLASSGKEALQIMQREECDIVFLDILMPGMDGFDVLRKMRRSYPHVAIIMITAVDTAKSAVEAMKLGAYHYITKPFDIHEIKSVIKKVLSEKLEFYGTPEIIGNSKKIREVLEIVKRVSQSKVPVLILGETGAGKELIARAIHFGSLRKDKPFIIINCAAIPDNLIESELFGHEKGAFTDAKERRLGRFELANGGTLFMDEIADLSLGTQARILRFLQYQELLRVGGNQTIKVNVRLIAATNKDLAKAVQDGKFREDLYYRIKVIPIHIPPLRERKEDVLLLVDHFIKRFSQKERKKIKGISKEALDYLISYGWPGNVRELENMIERIVTLSTRDFITEEDLPDELRLAKPFESIQELKEDKINLLHLEEELEKTLILDALKKANFVQTKAAHILGISRRILKYKMDKLNIKLPADST